MTPFVIGLLAIGLPGCDINITDGGDESSETEGGADTEGGEASTSSAASGGTDIGTTGGDDASSSTTSNMSGGDTTSGGEGETTATPGDESGETGAVGDVCNDEPDCQSCYQCSVLPGNACNDAAETCFSDADCSELVDCQSVCAGSSGTQDEYDTCMGTCAAETPTGVLLFNDLIACRESTCTNSCPGGGTACDIESADCQACVDCTVVEGGSCDPFVIACSESIDCVDLYTCQQECFSTSESQGQLNACLVNCEATYPGGIDLLLQLNACTNGSCSASCAG